MGGERVKKGVGGGSAEERRVKRGKERKEEINENKGKRCDRKGG